MTHNPTSSLSEPFSGSGVGSHAASPTGAVLGSAENEASSIRAISEDGGTTAAAPLSKNTNSSSSGNMKTASNTSFHAQERLSLSKLSLGLDEPIELQIETMSPAAGRAMFYFWYLLLALAIVVQSIVTLQWQALNMCDGNEVSLTEISSWSSPCATQSNYSVVNPTTNISTELSDIVWTGYIDTDPLARFLHLVFSMHNPNTSVTTSFDMSFGYTITNTTSTEIVIPNATAVFHIDCEAGKSRCSTVVMPTQSTGRPNATHVTLIAIGVNAKIGARVLQSSAVGSVNQKRGYTIASIVIRYSLMFLSLLHFARFLYHKKFTNTLYEQTWISILHGGLFLYLDPLFAAGVYIDPEPNVLAFLEFRVPTYFMTLLVAFMFSLITSSMSWTSASSIYNPPWWTKITALVFLSAIFALDIIDASRSEWDWNLEHCPNFSCDTLGYFLYGLLVLGVLVCTLWLYWLRNNLGLKPYLDSRPQQLAVRVFIFMFTTTVLYFIILILTIVFAFRDISGIVTFQALIQIPAILVSVFFVNIMTLVYTTTVRSQRVPIRPADERWKKAVWPESWYQWLSRHGGSMYIFNNEEEESLFYQIQAKFAIRRAQALAAPYQNYNPATQPDINSQDILIASESEVEGEDTTATGATPLSPHGGRIRFTVTRNGEELFNEEYDEESDESDDTQDEDEDTGPLEQRSPQRSPQLGQQGSSPTSKRSVDGGSYFPRSPGASGSSTKAPFGQSLTTESQPLFDDARRSSAAAARKKKAKKKRRSRYIASKIPGGERILDAVNSVTRSMSRLVGRAETELIDRTATFIDAVENRFVDIFNSKLRHKPFFNLETAIDCLNLSWEAYGVVESHGDGMITTGVNVRLPDVQPVAKKTMKAIASVFSMFSGRDVGHAPEEVDHEGQDTTPLARNYETGDNHEPLTEMSAPLASPSDDDPAKQRSSSTSPARAYGTTNSLPAPSPTSSQLPIPINTEQYGFERIAVAEEAAVQVVISKMIPGFARHQGKSPRIVIAFRGTDNVKNAKQDLDIRRVLWDEVDHTFWQSASASRPSVHVGFLGIWNALKDFVIDTVMKELDSLSAAADENDEPHRVFVTGHSMGGAVATLCAFVIRKRLIEVGYRFPDPVVYTYGQPRIGNKTFQKTYNKVIPNTFRVVNESDAVSFVTMLGGCHVGMEVDVDRNGNYLCEPMFMERTLRPIKGKGSAFANHMLSAYSESLNAIAAKCGRCESRCLEPYAKVQPPGSADRSPQQSVKEGSPVSEDAP
ncbi:lipase, putative [Bodo saltans]|uniref:Lipase, putative n=1 Tax=Bodo saltans TaxID=75058 RepID=A0A0S4JQ62_BODSA|nr:lipase, putative [Bodo saltans]|eukprot:CUG93655.1 lipase, putative [Bodo saltans]